MASSSTSTPTPPKKYDVFLSFRGEDTRCGFTSYLYDALKRKQILTFIDNELVRGDEISPSLLKAIEESKLSVIIFSENYASSKWCLEELVQILECRNNNGQIVVPVFYLVDPSHVRNQTGSFGDEFARLIEEKALAMNNVQSFRSALKDAANLSGWGLGKSELQSEFVQKIVGDILNKLSEMPSSHTMDLVGIEARLAEIDSLLNMESEDVSLVGIWGMGGIGKTTIAEAIWTNIHTQFEGTFFANFREELKTRSMVDLQRSFLSQLLGQEILNMGPSSFRHSFTRDGLHRKRVLIALDDVDNLMQLPEWKELILKHQSSFGRRSKILVTSRDKQLLKEMVGEECIYEVKGLNREEAFQLFSMKAFKSRNPTIDHENLLERTVDFAQGNPLALIVLGSALFGKSNEEWHSALNKLALDHRIENVLRISYDGLDHEQQSIFLDIAYFYRGWEQNHATRVLESCYPSALYNISTLIDKCLITVSHSMIRMHALLQEMALRIVDAESKNPGKRSSLCVPDDIVHVLKKKKGSDRIEGISLDTSKLSREMHLESDAFAKMDRLRFLKFYGDHLFTGFHLPSSGLKYLSEELRYLRWDGFPCKSLPQNFCAENLFELSFWGSKVEKLWRGEQDLVNLINCDLSCCECLTELPDLSKAKNLKVLSLVGCNSLIEVPSSLQCLEKLEVLNLFRCYNLRSLPSRFDSKKLREFTMTKCLGISKCPEIISRNMKKLNLSGTSVRDVAGSVTCEHIYLGGCSNISKFPEGLRDIIDLGLSGTAIEEVPSSIQFLTRLQILDMSGCSKLESFPETTEPIKSLDTLDLAKSGIKQLPSSLKYLVSLRNLNIEGTPIRELPELPPSLTLLRARDCASLETISTVNLRSGWIRLDFSNCFKLDQKALSADMHLKIQSAKMRKIEMMLPGSEIPEWLSNQGEGSSVTIQFPSNCQQLKGFAFSIAFLFPSNCQQLKGEVLRGLGCCVKTKTGEHEDLTYVSTLYCTPYCSDHTFLWYDAAVSENRFCKLFGKENIFSKYSGNEVTFEFYPEVFSPFVRMTKQELDEIEKLCKVKRCGVYLHFDENLPSKKYSDEYLI